MMLQIENRKHSVHHVKYVGIIILSERVQDRTPKALSLMTNRKDTERSILCEPTLSTRLSTEK